MLSPYVSYYVLKVWRAIGLVWDVHTPPEKVLAAGRPTTTRPATSDHD